MTKNNFDWFPPSKYDDQIPYLEATLRGTEKAIAQAQDELDKIGQSTNWSRKRIEAEVKLKRHIWDKESIEKEIKTVREWDLETTMRRREEFKREREGVKVLLSCLCPKELKQLEDRLGYTAKDLQKFTYQHNLVK